MERDLQKKVWPERSVDQKIWRRVDLSWGKQRMFFFLLFCACTLHYIASTWLEKECDPAREKAASLRDTQQPQIDKVTLKQMLAKHLS